MNAPPEQTNDVNKELVQAVSKPTPWNYRFSDLPWASTIYLNSLIGPTVIIDEEFSDVEQAVKFSIPMYEDYVQKLNSIRILRPYLSEFPATPEICLMAIRFPHPNKKTAPKPYVGTIVFYRDIEVKYWTPQADPKKAYLFHVQRFAPSEVPELLDLYQRGVPRKAVDPKPIIRPLEELEDRSPETAYYHFFEFIRKWAPEFSLKLILAGETDKLKNHCCDFSSLLIGTQQLSLQEARRIAATCGKASLQFINTDQKCVEYFKKESLEKKREIKPSPEYIAFRMSFWDENLDRVVQPYIAEVRFVNCLFTYYTADERQRLVLVHEETFDEAMKFLGQ